MLLLYFVILFFLDRRVKIKQVRGVVSIVGADGCRRFQPQPQAVWLQRNKLAQQTWRRHSTAIHRLSLKHSRLLHMLLARDNNCMDAIGKKFERNPLTRSWFLLRQTRRKRR